MSAVKLVLLDPQMVIYLFNLAVAASLICGVGLLAVRACRRGSAPVRHGILVGALVLVLLSPGAARLAQRSGWAWMEIAVFNHANSTGHPERVSLESLWGRSFANTSPSAITDLEQASATEQGGMPPIASGGPARLEPTPTVAAIAQVASDAENPLPPAVASRPGVVCWWQVLGTMLAFVWMAGMLAHVIRLAWGCRALGRFCRCLEEVAEPRVRALWQQAAEAVALCKAPRIFRSPFAPVPFCLGIVRPVIVVPGDILGELDDGQLQAVLIHEAAHLARRDTWVSLAQRIAVVLFWWNVLVYRLRDRIADLREEICDNYVCRAQREAARFAQTLVGLAARTTTQRLLPATLSILEPAGLMGRVTRLLDKERNMATRMNFVSRVSVAAWTGVVLLAVVFAGGPRIVYPLAAAAGGTKAEKLVADPGVAAGSAAAPADDHAQGDKAADAVNITYMIEQASGMVIMRPAAIFARPELAALAKLMEQSGSFVPKGTRLNDFRQITMIIPEAAVPSGPREILVWQWVKPVAAQYVAQHAADKDYTVKEYNGRKMHLSSRIGTAVEQDAFTLVTAGSEQAMGVYLAGKPGVLPKWLPAETWESFRDDHFVMAGDTAMIRRDMKALLEHSPPIVRAALMSISWLWEDATGLAAGAKLNDKLAVHAWAAAKDADSAAKLQRTAEALKTLAASLVKTFQAPSEAGRELQRSLPSALFDEADRLLGNMKFQQDGNNVQLQTSVELDKAKLDALATAIVGATQPPDASTKNGMMALVEDFFHHNYRDITSRETLEWGDFAKNGAGNFSIRYKYRCGYWYGEPTIRNQIFTFNPQGVFVSVNDAEKRPPLPPAHVYEVHKKVLDFPDREDLTTPEAAYASIQRAYAAEGDAAWLRFAVPAQAAHMQAGVKKPLPKQVADRLLGAEIIEVHVWDGTHAVVIALEEDPATGRGYMDMRWLDRVNGRWLNQSNDSRRSSRGRPPENRR